MYSDAPLSTGAQRDAREKGLRADTQRLDDSIEEVKEQNDFLKGVSAIVQGIRDSKITCRVYRKDKFRATAHITHARLEVAGSSALITTVSNRFQNDWAGSQ